MQEIAKRLKNCEEFVAKNQIEQGKQDLMNLSLHQERNPTTLSQLLTQIRELQNKLNSLSDAREFFDPESRSSSGATHVPGTQSEVEQNSVILTCTILPGSYISLTDNCA